MSYTSIRFIEQLSRYIEAFPELDLSKQQSDDHVLDLQRRTVLKKQFKKYKFDAAMPFDFVNTVDFVNVSNINPFYVSIELLHSSTVLEQYFDKCHVH